MFKEKFVLKTVSQMKDFVNAPDGDVMVVWSRRRQTEVNANNSIIQGSKY